MTVIDDGRYVMCTHMRRNVLREKDFSFQFPIIYRERLVI